eukprot:1030343-Rhodomonas_salina.1
MTESRPAASPSSLPIAPSSFPAVSAIAFRPPVSSARSAAIPPCTCRSTPASHASLSSTLSPPAPTSAMVSAERSWAARGL